jgi:regulator of sirC expression with transglutaminase-like and TPR domain
MTLSPAEPPETTLRRLGSQPDEHVDLMEAALAFAAAGRPGRSTEPYLNRLAQWRRVFRQQAGDIRTASARAQALRNFLFVEYGFTGDRERYDDLDNADLMAVLDRRKGLPVAIGILYLDMAKAAGWPAAGLDFPSHFLIRVEGDGERVVIDPFNGGATVEAADMRAILKRLVGPAAELRPHYYAPISSKAVLLRLQNNIKIRAIRAGDMTMATEVLRRMLLLDPLFAEGWYELAVLEIHLGKPRSARDALESCLNALDSGPERTALRAQVMETLAALAAELNS